MVPAGSQQLQGRGRANALFHRTVSVYAWMAGSDRSDVQTLSDCRSLLFDEQQQMEDKMSEVARLLAQIDAENEAANQALHGLAQGTARHDFINARMERIDRLVQRLKTEVGDQEAMRLLYESMQNGGE